MGLLPYSAAGPAPLPLPLLPSGAACRPCAATQCSTSSGCVWGCGQHKQLEELSSKKGSQKCWCDEQRAAQLHLHAAQPLTNSWQLLKPERSMPTWLGGGGIMP